MNEAKKLLVEACPGRTVPIHARDYPHTRGQQFVLRADDGPVEVRDSAGIRRRIKAGDLKRSTAQPAPVASPPVSSSAK